MCAGGNQTQAARWATSFLHPPALHLGCTSPGDLKQKQKQKQTPVPGLRDSHPTDLGYTGPGDFERRCAAKVENHGGRPGKTETRRVPGWSCPLTRKQTHRSTVFLNACSGRNFLRWPWVKPGLLSPLRPQLPTPDPARPCGCPHGTTGHPRGGCVSPDGHSGRAGFQLRSQCEEPASPHSALPSTPLGLGKRQNHGPGPQEPGAGPPLGTGLESRVDHGPRAPRVIRPAQNGLCHPGGAQGKGCKPLARGLPAFAGSTCISFPLGLEIGPEGQGGSLGVLRGHWGECTVGVGLALIHLGEVLASHGS